MLNEKISKRCETLLASTEQKISLERKAILDDIAQMICDEVKNNNDVELVYLCTHNSRRSHFAQVWGHVASVLFGFDLKTYSGGTVATECHPNTIATLRNIGFRISSDNLAQENPLYKVYYNDKDYIACYSKANTDSTLPQADFIAIMTCSDSDDNCPFVPGAKKRFSTTYDDPKEFDGTDNALIQYETRSLQIAQEALYTFKKAAGLRG
tara:strand:- start:4549 stop:5178 length:630 start_codon:yes stop_codon:yes gene_type:complete